MSTRVWRRSPRRCDLGAIVRLPPARDGQAAQGAERAALPWSRETALSAAAKSSPGRGRGGRRGPEPRAGALLPGRCDRSPAPLPRWAPAAPAPSAAPRRWRRRRAGGLPPPGRPPERPPERSPRSPSCTPPHLRKGRRSRPRRRCGCRADSRSPRTPRSQLGPPRPARPEVGTVALGTRGAPRRPPARARPAAPCRRPGRGPGGRGAGREPGTPGAHRGHRPLSPAAPEKQEGSARSSSAETRAGRPRSKTRVTPEAGESPSGVGGAAGAFRARRAGAGGDRAGSGRRWPSPRRRAPRGPAPHPPQPSTPTPQNPARSWQKLRAKQGAPRPRGFGAAGCCARELRNAHAGEPEATTKEPERPRGWRPRPCSRDEGEGGGRKMQRAQPSGTPNPWARSRPGRQACGLGWWGGERVRRWAVSQCPRHPACLCIFSGSLGSEANFAPRLRRPWARRTGGCVGDGGQLGTLPL